MVSNIYQGDNTALSESVDPYQPSSTEGKEKGGAGKDKDRNRRGKRLDSCQEGKTFPFQP